MADANDNDPDAELTRVTIAKRPRRSWSVWLLDLYAAPKPETVQRTGVKTPDFDRTTFREMLVKSHRECGIEIEETACCKEPDEN